MESGSKPATLRPRPAAPAGSGSLGRRVGVAAAVAAVLAAAVGAFMVLGGDDAGRPASDGPVSTAVSVAALRALPEQTGHPVYWAGPRAGHTYELTRPTDGSVYVRYLPPGVRVGDRRPDFTTIGTYPRRGAGRDLRRLGRQPGAVTIPLGEGVIAVYTRAQPRSVYLGFPGRDLQVEVYDPSPREARRLARSGRVRPVG
ncbi:MAG TPA: hypothetical protein VFB51_00565 [Solirubrobacterales bacterium]|nr:hypothetical protein [Solirubrobacterales bacterium]